ncbi:hypothetical protein AX16_000106 [Volvariella volvacea WC 439]|nr:hypothetical protein AX16_000106 [Volvariella volvacea WC 439]
MSRGAKKRRDCEQRLLHLSGNLTTLKESCGRWDLKYAFGFPVIAPNPMAAHSTTGSSTPLSSRTISCPPSPKPKDAAALPLQNVYYNPRIPASSIIEYLASRPINSSTVYVYDLAEQVGFGTLTKEWSRSTNDAISVVDLQTRAGAGLSLVGRLSEGTSQDTVTGAVLTAYTTPNGLSVMAPSLSYLPPASEKSRLVIQVPNVTPSSATATLSPSLASLATAFPILPDNLTILLSATPQQAVDFTNLSYSLVNSHVIHIFDHHSSTREIGHSIVPLDGKSSDLEEAMATAGHQFFSYRGDPQARTVLIALNGPLALLAQALSAHAPGFGVVAVNVFRPWNEDALRHVLPATAQNIHVLDDVPNAVTQGALYPEVFGALLGSAPSYKIRGHRITPTQTQDYLTQQDRFLAFISELLSIPSSPLPSLLTPKSKSLVFFNTPQSPLNTLAHAIEYLFLSHKGISVRSLTDYDVFSKPGGIVASRLLLAPNGGIGTNVPLPFALPFDSSNSGQIDFLAVLDHSLLTSHAVLEYAKPSSPVLLVTSWTPSELSANLSARVLRIIQERSLRVFTLNAQALATNLVGAAGPTHDAVQGLLVQLAFLRLYLGSAATQSTVLKAATPAFGQAVQGALSLKINAQAWAGLEEVSLEAPLQSSTVPMKEFEFSTIAVESEGEIVVNGARLGSWHDAAKHLLFPSAYAFPPSQASETEDFPQNPALRPEIPDRTYLVTCTVNRRLTPLEYDRNVFHLEFDTRGTGLKYAIGEALGVHGWNDEQEVLDFCKWYNVDPNRLITIPVPNQEGRMHTRTILQALQQQIDLFGKPPKSFYYDLAAFATNKVDKHALQFIGSPEGSSTFKKLSEKDTVTFAEVLQKYPSAKPGIERLCELIGDIKPRHYSIASSQEVVGDRVDLLVVTVDWETPNGIKRYGQCTRYLADLKIGQKVTVSIKPSVMKLPPDPKQPLIMAGLGTGAAPFRAFLQHLAWLQWQGKEIGPVYYYFGSRHQSQEYLYGEEIESFIQDGTITRAGLAFSRDGPKKVYIQHKMLEDSEALADMLKNRKGVFYLCGPTWPVPDVFEALVNALVKYQGESEESAAEYLESLKEEERYVLEVY